MQELTQLELETEVLPPFLYFYTPLCGACVIAKQMVEIVEQAQQFDTLAINLNHFPSFAQQFQIEQVPCLISTETQAKLYIFANVVNIYQFCQTQRK
ncbi:MAG: thioredoxin family protein [Culicoidibacterales bacterium]